MDKMIRLHLGCGSKRLEGFTNIDMVDTSASDLVDDISTLEGFEANSVYRIVTEHAIEHLSFEEAEGALARWFELLMPGGYLCLETPDMVQTCAEFALWAGNMELTPEEMLDRYPTLRFLKDRGDWGIYRNWGRMRNLFGVQDSPGQYHKSGWWEGRLREVCEAIGYTGLRFLRSVDVPGYQTSENYGKELTAYGFSNHAREEPCIMMSACKPRGDE